MPATSVDDPAVDTVTGLDDLSVFELEALEDSGEDDSENETSEEGSSSETDDQVTYNHYYLVLVT